MKERIILIEKQIVKRKDEIAAERQAFRVSLQRDAQWMGPIYRYLGVTVELRLR